MMGSCTYLLVACMADTQNVRGKDDLGSQGWSSSHAVPYFFIRSSRSSPLPLQLVIKCAVSSFGWVSNLLRWWGTIWEEVRTTEWTVPVFFASLPRHFNSRGSPLGIFEIRLVALKVITQFRPILRKKNRSKRRTVNSVREERASHFFVIPVTHVSSPLLSFQFEGLTRLFQFSLLSHSHYRWSDSWKRLTSTHVFWLPHLSAFTIINNTSVLSLNHCVMQQNPSAC